MSINEQLSHSYVCEYCKDTYFICNYCDKEFNSRSWLHVTLLKHIGTCHADSSVIGNVGILDIYCDSNLIYGHDFIVVFPQLCLLKISDINQYKKCMNDTLGKSSRLITMKHVVSEITEENADNMRDLICAKGANLIRNFTYCCVVCGLEYENGIPDIHMVVRHFVRCKAANG